MSNEAVIPNYPVVFCDIEIGGESVGRIYMQLFNDVAPEIAETFRLCCLGTVREGSAAGFRGSMFHRVIKEYLIHAGNFLMVDGRPYGSQVKDGDFIYTHAHRGLLTLANKEPNANGYQFFITFDKCHWLDGKHVVFGQVCDEESMKVLKLIEEVDVSPHDRPIKDCVISGCGQYY